MRLGERASGDDEPLGSFRSIYGPNPNARSWVGARGLMQLMPSTYKDIQSRATGFGEIDDPEWNIAAGIMHDRGLWRRWNAGMRKQAQSRRGPTARVKSLRGFRFP